MYRQGLTDPADAETAVRRLIGVQAQYFGNALHAVRIRSKEIPQMLPETLVKTWSLRGTLHLHARADLPMLLYDGSRTVFGQLAFTTEEISDARKRMFSELVLESVQSGEGDRTALRKRCIDAGMTEREDAILFHPWGGLPRALCERGKLSYAASAERRFVPLASFLPLDAETAQTQLMERYLAGYAPVTLRDAAYFFGWPQSVCRRLLEKTGARQTMALETAYYEPEDAARNAPDAPDCLFLAGFDPMLLGYQKADNPILPGRSLRRVFNLAGIVFPSLLLRGEIAGTWKRTGRTLHIALFHAPDKASKRMIEICAGTIFGDDVRKLVIETE